MVARLALVIACCSLSVAIAGQDRAAQFVNDHSAQTPGWLLVVVGGCTALAVAFIAMSTIFVIPQGFGTFFACLVLAGMFGAFVYDTIWNTNPDQGFFGYDDLPASFRVGRDLFGLQLLGMMGTVIWVIAAGVRVRTRTYERLFS